MYQIRNLFILVFAVATFLVAIPTVAEASGPFQYKSSFSTGTAPAGLALINGEICTASIASNVVMCYNSAGEYTGNAIGGLSNPTDLAVDTARCRIYVAEWYVSYPNGRVTIYDCNTFAKVGTLVSSIYLPESVAVDAEGNVWVAHTESDYTTTQVGPTLDKYSPGGTLLLTTAPNGRDPGQVDHIGDIVEHPITHEIVVTDRNASRLVFFNKTTGAYTRQIMGINPDPWGEAKHLWIDPTSGEYIVSVRWLESSAWHVAVKRFSSSGALLETLGNGTIGSGAGQFNEPRGVLGVDGHLYISDGMNNRIQDWVDTSKYQGNISTFTATAGSSGNVLNLTKNSLTASVIILRSSNGCATSPTPDATHQKIAQITGTSYTDATAVQGVKYCYSGYGVDPWGHVAPTPKNVEITSYTAPPKGAITSFYAKALASGISLTWGKNASTVSTRIYRASTCSGTAGTLVYDGTGTSFKDTSLPEGTKVCYSAYASDGSKLTTTAVNRWATSMQTPVVSFRSSLERLVFGTKTKFSGHLKNKAGKALSSKKIYIQYKPCGSTTWKWLATKYTSSTGYYQHWHKAKGCSDFRAKAAQSGSYKVAYSDSQTVQATPYFTGKLSDSSIRVGGKSYFSGKYLSGSGKAMRYKPVYIQYADPYSGSDWHYLKTVKTGYYGTYRASIKGNWCGGRYIRSKVKGEALYSKPRYIYVKCPQGS